NLSSLAIYHDDGHFPTRVDTWNTIFAFSNEGNNYSSSVTLSGGGNLYWANEDRQVKGDDREDLTTSDINAGRAPDSKAIAVDPLFVNHVSATSKLDMGTPFDYHLQQGSPAMASGCA